MGKLSRIIVVASLVLSLLSPMTAMAGNYWPAHRPGLAKALLPLLPTAVANAVPVNAVVGEKVEFSSRGSFHPLSGENLTFSWDFGDGISPITYKDLHTDPARAYTAAGTYIAVLRVMDSRGFVDEDTVVITVTDPLLVEASVLDCGVAPCIFRFEASVTGGVQPYTFLWDFGDGTTGTGQAPSHDYGPLMSEFVATVTVTDGSVATVTDSVVVVADGGMPPGGEPPPMP